MALLSETNEQYYGGQQAFIGGVDKFIWTGDTQLIATTNTTNTNFKVKVNNVVWTEVSVAPAASGEYQLSSINEISTFAGAVGAADVLVIELLDGAKWANYGGYSYIKMEDVINNFMIGYVGENKLIPHVKRTDILFHAQRGLQEFSYDTLKSIKSQELTVPDSLSLIIPQDYVNYVRLSWIDDYGVQHPIYPVNNLTDSPYTVPIQDGDGIPTQDGLGENLEGSSITDERWRTANDRLINGNLTWDEFYNASVYDWRWDKLAYGQRYGLEPQTSQRNGWFNINEREGKFSFSSNLKSRLIILEYISDGLAIDYDMRVPKMAEEAIYMHIAYSILSTRSNVQEYIVQRFKRDRRAALRNAKIRLSNIKLGEITQVMRGKSKWIKH
tara:strand:- start:386 stop:1540 length:1155 start_codon:yes stop_codon:yes gene_type:complete